MQALKYPTFDLEPDSDKAELLRYARLFRHI